MRKSIITVLSAALTVLAVPAAAEQAMPEVPATVEVKIADLDLTSPAGAETLESRIDAAAERVCVKPDMKSIKAMQAFEVCQAEARDSAMEQLSVANPFDGMALASLF